MNMKFMIDNHIPDPVWQDSENGLWYFCDETWSESLGPWDTEEEARDKLRRYGEWLNHGCPQCGETGHHWCCPNCGVIECYGHCMTDYNIYHGHTLDESIGCVYCNYPEDRLIFMFDCPKCPAFGWGVVQDNGSTQCLRCQEYYNDNGEQCGPLIDGVEF